MTLVTRLSSIFYLSNGSLDAFHHVIHMVWSSVSGDLKYLFPYTLNQKVLLVFAKSVMSVLCGLVHGLCPGNVSVDMILG